MFYEEIIGMLNTITDLTESQKIALDKAIECVGKEIPKDIIIDTTDMDENLNDYSYICPLCSCHVSDDNESVGRCSCGQLLNIPDIYAWLEEFQKTHHFSFKTRKWCKNRKRLRKV